LIVDPRNEQSDGYRPADEKDEGPEEVNGADKVDVVILAAGLTIRIILESPDSYADT